MGDTAIQVSGLGKRYRLGGAPARGIQELITRGLGRLRSALGPDDTANDFWALRDLDFEIPRGQVVGIVGRNGAGKSTLLKILSRITPPTTGRAVIEGRVSSLLEVGTGFHPELTGRDNIFLNGAILGMRRAEIRAKFDEIVAFAEVERFIDTPVKHYSSGMYVRLAFAVAAHLDPEILIIDEVLAVGDAQFQEKCLGKMDTIARSGGRTILFVSHNTAAVRSLCRRAILLDSGRVAMDGSVEDTLARYMDLHTRSDTPALARLQQGAAPGLRFGSLTLNGSPLCLQALACATLPLSIALAFETSEPLRASLQLHLSDRHGSRIAISSPGFDTEGGSLHALPAGRHELTVRITLPALVKGVYFLDVLLLQPYVCYYATFTQAFELHVDGSGNTWEKVYETYNVDMGRMILPSEVRNTTPARP